MTITEYIKKLHEYASDVGPEDEVQLTPSRLLMVYDTELWKEYTEIRGKLYKAMTRFYRG